MGIKILLLLAIGLNIIFTYKAFRRKKSIKYIGDTLSEIRQSGFNRRLHLGLYHKEFRILGTELNMLLDRFQEMLEEKERLETAHKKLTSNISHDIRTPLTSILGYIEVLKNVENMGKEEQEDYLRVIEAKAQWLYRIVQEFFELSKLESEDMDIELEKVDIAEAAREELLVFYQDFKAKGITPVVEIPDNAVYVMGDKLYIVRILNNLISNSLKYGASGGIIGLRIRENGEKVWVDIWDRGKGIPEKDIPFLFNRLYTGESSRNSDMRGSGLGLAIAKHLVEKQKGEIMATSIPGEKTTFSFHLRNL